MGMELRIDYRMKIESFKMRIVYSFHSLAGKKNWNDFFLGYFILTAGWNLELVAMVLGMELEVYSQLIIIVVRVI